MGRWWMRVVLAMVVVAIAPGGSHQALAGSGSAGSGSAGASGSSSRSGSVDERINQLLPRLVTSAGDERVEAAIAIGALGPQAERAVRPLSELLRAASAEDAGFREAAIEALGSIGSAAGAPVLSLLLSRGGDTGPVGDRYTTQAALDWGRRFRPLVADAPLQRAARAALLRIGLGGPVDDTLPAIRSGAARALEDGHPQVREAAAAVLFALGAEANDVTRLVQGLHDELPSVRRRIAMTLGQLGSKSACPALFASLSDVDHGVRWVLVEAIGQITCTVDRDQLGRLLALRLDPTAGVQDATAWAAGALGTAAADSLMVLANDPMEADRGWAFQALRHAGVGARGVAPVLISIVSNEHGDVDDGLQALLTLVAVAPDEPTTAEAIASCLASQHIRKRNGAAEAIRRLGVAAIQPVAHSLKTDFDCDTRRTAVHTLGLWCSVSTPITEVLQALTDDDCVGEDAAAALLGQTR